MTQNAVILAAGRGRKFWPYNEVRNKCAFPIANRPVVLRLAEQLLEIGFSHITVVTGSLAGSVRAALRPLDTDRVRFVRQDEADGAGTVPAALTGLGAAADGDAAVLIVYGDTLADRDDIAAVWSAVARGDAPAAALAAPLDGERTQDWICAGISDAGGDAVLSGIEAHGRGGSHRLAGVFALSSRALRYLRSQAETIECVPVGGMPPPEADISGTLAAMIEDGLPVRAIQAQRPIVDLDKPWHILQATAAALDAMRRDTHGDAIETTARISDGADIRGPIVVGAGATVGRGVVIDGPAWIGARARVLNGAVIGGGVVVGACARVSDYCQVGGGSVIGPECIVGHCAELDGVMLRRSYLYHYCEIYGVVGAAADIGAATVCGTLRFDDGATVHNIGGRREFPLAGANATYFGDCCRTGVNVITQPGVKIGSYSCVGPGIVVYRDVPSRKLLLLKQEIEEHDWGPERYGW